MMRKKWAFLTVFAAFATGAFAQQTSDAFQIGLIGFYNLENLFDTIDSPDTNDAEFTPGGANAWTGKLYAEKQGNMARVISEIGVNLSPDGLSILGVAEIENRLVLEELVAQPAISRRNYQIVHYDSPDQRGIDVGLLYNPKYYKVTESRAVPLMVYEPGDSSRIYTRDVLVVGGLYLGEPLYVLVNHWPSRRGGEAASQPLRNAGAFLCKNICDTILQKTPGANIIIMGDLNDDPTSPSVAQVLDAKGKVNQVNQGGYFNPMLDFYRRGLGTLAYRDAWSLFDQLILNHNLLDKEPATGLRYHQAYIFNPPYMVQKSGQYRGYPYRTFAGGAYAGGFSDHFPVYLTVLKPVAR